MKKCHISQPRRRFNKLGSLEATLFQNYELWSVEQLAQIEIEECLLKMWNTNFICISIMFCCCKKLLSDRLVFFLGGAGRSKGWCSSGLWHSVAAILRAVWQYLIFEDNIWRQYLKTIFKGSNWRVISRSFPGCSSSTAPLYQPDQWKHVMSFSVNNRPVVTCGKKGW